MFAGTKGPLGTAFVQFRESGGKDAKMNTLGEITVIFWEEKKTLFPQNKLFYSQQGLDLVRIV